MQGLRLRPRMQHNLILNLGSSGGVELPNQEDVLFSLQSINGNNMIDSVNGWEFPITGKDWEDTDYIGLYYLPWKTEATIAAPADGTPAATAIQAVDTNNFWYEAGGTAKDIPVQAFFQNIDFDNLIFCKHAARLTLSWGVETLPTGASYITMYDSAQTIDSSFTTFFGSEIEPTAGAYFVTKSGNDTTGDGSQSLPFLTIQKAVDTIKAAGGGGTTYVGSGIFDEDNGSGYLYMNDKDELYEFIGMGNTVMTSPSTNYIWRSRSTPNDWYGFRFDGETNTNSFFSSDRDFGATDLTPDYKFYQCGFIGNTTKFGYDTFHDLRVFKDSVYTKYIQMYTNDRETCNWEGSLVNYIKPANEPGSTIVYCKIVSESITDASHIFEPKDSITISYNHFKCAGVCIETDLITTRTGDYTFTCKYNVFEHDYSVGSAAFMGVWSRDDDAVWDFQYNKLVGTPTTSIPDLGEYLFLSTNLGTTTEISNNHVRSYAHGLQYFISMMSAKATLLNVTNNYVHSDAEDGQYITCTEGTNQNRFNGSTFAYNRIIGCFENRGYAVSGGAHGMLVSQGIDYKVYGNYISHCPLGLVWKQYQQTTTQNGIWGNLFYNNTDHIYVRRSDGGFVYNNTFLWDSNMPASSTRSCFKLDDQFTVSPSANWKFTNNLCVYAGSQPYLTPLWFEQASNLVGFEANDNVFYNVDTDAFIYDVNTTTTYTQAQSITNGWAADIDNNDPDITSIPGSPYPTTAISGTDLSDTYKPSLGYDTEWDGTVNGLTLPIPEVTYNLRSIWEKGAYVQSADHRVVKDGSSNPVKDSSGDQVILKNY